MEHNKDILKNVDNQSALIIIDFHFIFAHTKVVNGNRNCYQTVAANIVEFF